MKICGVRGTMHVAVWVLDVIQFVDITNVLNFPVCLYLTWDHVLEPGNTQDVRDLLARASFKF